MGLFRKKKRQPVLTRDQALAYTPVRNNVVNWEVLDSGLVRIEYMLVLKPLLCLYKALSRDLTRFLEKSARVTWSRTAFSNLSAGIRWPGQVDLPLRK